MPHICSFRTFALQATVYRKNFQILLVIEIGQVVHGIDDIQTSMDIEGGGQGCVQML